MSKEALLQSQSYPGMCVTVFISIVDFQVDGFVAMVHSMNRRAVSSLDAYLWGHMKDLMSR